MDPPVVSIEAVVGLATDETLGCLLDVLGRRKREPDRDGRLVAAEVLERAIPPFWDGAPWALEDILVSLKP